MLFLYQFMHKVEYKYVFWKWFFTIETVFHRILQHFSVFLEHFGHFIAHSFSWKKWNIPILSVFSSMNMKTVWKRASRRFSTPFPECISTTPYMYVHHALEASSWETRWCLRLKGMLQKRCQAMPIQEEPGAVSPATKKIAKPEKLDDMFCNWEKSTSFSEALQKDLQSQTRPCRSDAGRNPSYEDSVSWCSSPY